LSTNGVCKGEGRKEEREEGRKKEKSIDPGFSPEIKKKEKINCPGLQPGMNRYRSI
jgi:hypothetical protein